MLEKKDTGKFATSTKTKIKTEYGTILKVITYDPENEEPLEEFKIRPKCYCCKEPMECFCYNDDNCDPGTDKFELAKKELKREWVCLRTSCLIKTLKDTNPERYEEMRKSLITDENIADEIKEYLSDIDTEEGSFCGW